MNKQAIYNDLKDQSMTILFSGKSYIRSNDTEFDFSVNRNFFYLTNLDFENVKLIITKANNIIEEVLFIEMRDPKMVKWIGEGPNPDLVKELSGINDVRDIKEFDDYVKEKLVTFESLYLDLDTIRSTDKYTDAKYFKTELVSEYPDVKIDNVLEIFAKYRQMKSSKEIDDMKKAIDITQGGLEAMFKNIKPGMKEYQIVTYFDQSIRYNGANDNSFQTIAASGKGATVLHYIKNDRIMEDGDLVLFDLGAEYNNYAADISRTIPVNGKFTERQKAVYELCLKANMEAIKAVKPKTTLRELNELTKSILEKGLIELGVIKGDKTISDFYYHGVGHYLGLDVHDIALPNQELAPGMVITIEPGIYIADESIGIRIEDDILVTEDGHINLSEGIIKSVKEIEDFMN